MPGPGMNHLPFPTLLLWQVEGLEHMPVLSWGVHACPDWRAVCELLTRPRLDVLAYMPWQQRNVGWGSGG